MTSIMVFSMYSKRSRASKTAAKKRAAAKKQTVFKPKPTAK